MYATIWAESNFNLFAKNENRLNGQLMSTDWGICQWNDYYHGKEITPDEPAIIPRRPSGSCVLIGSAGNERYGSPIRMASYKRYL